MRKLLKWTPGSTDAIDTGLTDTDKHIDDDALDRGFKIAASAETVYVGKRDGKLFQSIDGGNSWQDVTPNILSSSSQIKDIIFVGSTVYVATDIGVLTSGDGERWSLLTDNIGTSIIIDRFAMEGSSFYGAGGKGVYSLDSRGRWEQILANIPDKVISLSASHDKLYIGTEKLGIFHTSLEEDPPVFRGWACKRARGAMNCATTNRKVCPRRNELRDYKRESVQEARDLRNYKQRGAMNCATTNRNK